MASVSSNQIRIVFSDVDGTFADARHQPIPESRPAVVMMAERGIPLCLVSARMPEGLATFHDVLGFTGPLVCYSGAYVLDEDGNELLSLPIAAAVAEEVKGFLARKVPDACCSVYGYHSWVVDDDQDPRVRNEEQLVHVKAEVCHDIAGHFGAGVHKLLLMGEPPMILAAEECAKKAYPGLAVTRSSDILLEIMSGEASKSRGIRVVCDHYGIDPSDAVAFGDGCNDLDMLRFVRRSWAMANGEPEVKRAASHVTTWTNDENGVARTIRELLASEG